MNATVKKGREALIPEYVPSMPPLNVEKSEGEGTISEAIANRETEVVQQFWILRDHSGNSSFFLVFAERHASF